jgi:hypothetical protein
VWFFINQYKIDKKHKKKYSISMSIIEANRADNLEQAPVFEPRYDMSDEETAFLTSKLLQEQHDTIPGNNLPFVCFRIKGSSEFANLARGIEGKVFTLDLNDKPEEMKTELEDYEDQSYFFLVVNMYEQAPVAALRVIENGPEGFSSVNAIKEPPHSIDEQRFYADYNIDPDKTWDVGTIAVLPDYRRGAHSNNETLTVEQKKYKILESDIVSGLLYRSLYAGARANGIDNFVSMIDLKALSILRGMGIPFVDIYDMPPKIYFDGSVFQPSYADVTKFDSAMRGYAQSKIDSAQNELDSKRGKKLQGLVDELLTGNALDGMMAFRYNNASTNSVN